MTLEIIHVLRALAALIAGALVGLGFGMVQNLAFRRNERLQRSGALKSGWAVMPGSMRRISGLLLALVVVQVFCPLLFKDGSQWWVSGGVVFGYGALLVQRLRERH